MKALQAYIDRENKWSSLFKGHTLVEIQTAAGRQRLAERIDSALSPENLTCDGELSRAQVNARYRELTTVAKQLKQLDPSVTFYEYDEEIA
jgi:hypothetical protein